MCGIAGWLSWSAPPDAGVVAEMTEALRHRGPDGTGVRALGPLVLGHQRLAVIDTRHSNDQPLATSDEAYWISYNGEIYNYQALRRELEGLGAGFRTAGDTEVILEAYRHWGAACLERLDGMFAFALWDARAQELFLARDRAGEKPLFYAGLPEGGLVFASEPRALRRHPAIDAEIDPAALAHYLTLSYLPGERTLIAPVRRLPAAHSLTVGRDGSRRIDRYWDLARAFREKRAYRSEAEAAEALDAQLRASVRGCMVADVPLGAFLSGGIDSSIIVAKMAELTGAGAVNSFSMGFEEKAFSELEEARRVADHLGVTHRDKVLMPTPEDMIAGMVHAADEPIADSSILPTYWLASLAREKVKVVLSGDGGDECFAGYETYLADRLHGLLRWLPRPFGRTLRGAVERWWPVSYGKVSFDYKLRQFLAGLALPPERAHYSWRTIFDARERRGLMNGPWRQAMDEVDAFDSFEPHFREIADCHPLDQALYVDFKTWLADDILVKLDRMTMAHSLESRAPFLDHHLVELAASLPVAWKLKGFGKKHLLKRSQRGRLPDWLLNRPKRGFNSPISQWLQGPLRDFAMDTLAERRLENWLHRPALEALWAEHLAGRRDNGLKLFSLIGFALWLKAL